VITLYNRLWETSRELCIEAVTAVDITSMSPETLIETTATAVRHWTKTHGLVALSISRREGLRLTLLKAKS
jgi:hypothetical protein